MAEAKKSMPVPGPAPALTPASESTDPALQALLAQRHAHEMNGDAEAAAAITRQLAELGYC
jgi:hypothetical protein